MRKIYVASSWRNADQPQVVKALRASRHDVYDFRHPEIGNNGFHWSDIDTNWKLWTPEEFKNGLNNPIAVDGFALDFDAMKWANTCVLLTPCGRSAHLEAGYFVGAGKTLIILLSDGEPELMYSMASRICTSLDEVLSVLAQPKTDQRGILNSQTRNSRSAD